MVHVHTHNMPRHVYTCTRAHTEHMYNNDSDGQSLSSQNSQLAGGREYTVRQLHRPPGTEMDWGWGVTNKVGIRRLGGAGRY